MTPIDRQKSNGFCLPFFENNKGLKVNSKTYNIHLEKERLPEFNRIMNNNWIFIQNSAPSHRANIAQDFLKEKLGKRFMKHTELPPSSLDSNPLDCHFWSKTNKKCMKTDSTNLLETQAN